MQLNSRDKAVIACVLELVKIKKIYDDSKETQPDVAYQEIDFPTDLDARDRKMVKHLSSFNLWNCDGFLIFIDKCYLICLSSYQT